MTTQQKQTPELLRDSAKNIRECALRAPTMAEQRADMDYAESLERQADELEVAIKESREVAV